MFFNCFLFVSYLIVAIQIKNWIFKELEELGVGHMTDVWKWLENEKKFCVLYAILNADLPLFLDD